MHRNAGRGILKPEGGSVTRDGRPKGSGARIMGKGSVEAKGAGEWGRDGDSGGGHLEARGWAKRRGEEEREGGGTVHAGAIRKRARGGREVRAPARVGRGLARGLHTPVSEAAPVLLRALWAAPAPAGWGVGAPQPPTRFLFLSLWKSIAKHHKLSA